MQSAPKESGARGKGVPAERIEERFPCLVTKYLFAGNPSGGAGLFG